MNFKITDHLTAECEYYERANSWGHTGKVYRDGAVIAQHHIRYYNRTWESYEFETLLKALKAKVERRLSGAEIKAFDEAIRHGGDQQHSMLKSIGLIASLGDMFCDTQKAKNDWKERMLRAGLGDKGLIMPEDWDQLDETEKQARLDGAISAIR